MLGFNYMLLHKGYTSVYIYIYNLQSKPDALLNGVSQQDARCKMKENVSCASSWRQLAAG